MWKPELLIVGEEEKSKAPRSMFPASYLRTRDPSRVVLGNGLFHKQGANQFEECSSDMGAETYWPWGHSVGDLNADGFQDVFVTSCMNYPFRYHTNSVLLNDKGHGFVDSEFVLGIEPRRGGRVAAPWFELDCSGPDKGHPAARRHTGKVTVWGSLG